MKKTIMFALLLISTLSAGATGQDGDIIYIDGVEWQLLGKPLCQDSVIYKQVLAALPQDRNWTTANWDGYTAVWSIKDNKLVLESVSNLSQDKLISIFQNTGYEPLVASWYNGTIRVAKGKCIYYVHSGFMRNYEAELHLEIVNGEVVDKTLYNNKILADGFAITGRTNNNDLTKKLFPVDPNKYPELKGVKIVVSIEDIKVDAEGNLIDCNLGVHGVDKSYAKYQQLEDEINNMAKAIKPWRTLLINGEIRPENKNIIFKIDFDEK
ncbi:MAG: hypothetical protein IKW83_05995 [Muribaculaceae bacterium]|nr:hypothetical protein [Muribaculaceae bacterium]